MISFCILCISYTGARAAPNIKFEQTSFDFGKVIQGQTVTHIFEFQNIGDETLTIKNVRAG